MQLKDELVLIDGGKFKNVIEALDIRENCRDCRYFSPKSQRNGVGHSCRKTPTCIGETLSKPMLRYIWLKLGMISEYEYHTGKRLKLGDVGQLVKKGADEWQKTR